MFLGHAHLNSVAPPFAPAKQRLDVHLVHPPPQPMQPPDLRARVRTWRDGLPRLRSRVIVFVTNDADGDLEEAQDGHGGLGEDDVGQENHAEVPSITGDDLV